ncbi:MAG: LamG domain-containing protein, partial [Planctomycetota bacterium]
YTEGDTTVAAEKAIVILAICPTGTALSFDGVDDYVDCGSDKSLDVTELTWSLWVKRAETTYTNERALISNEGGGANTRGTYALQIDVGSQRQDKIQFVRHGDSTWPISNTAIQDTDWHYIAVTRDSSGVAVIYIDGISDSTGNIGARTAFTKTVIGAGHTSYSNFNGLIDEVAIYNRALAGSEIWANMHNRLTGDEPGLVGYWDFDEGMGQIVYDLSGNDNHGQLDSTPDVDASDPAWIESDAPIGRCTPYLIATGSIQKALKHKKASLEKLEAALVEEWTAYEALDALLESGDYGDLKKGDIVTARQRIHSAMQHQEQAINTLEKSIKQLEDALIELGYEPIPLPLLPAP